MRVRTRRFLQYTDHLQKYVSLPTPEVRTGGTFISDCLPKYWINFKSSLTHQVLSPRSSNVSAKSFWTQFRKCRMCSVTYLLIGQNLCVIQGTAAGQIASKLFKARCGGCSHIPIFILHSSDYVSQSPKCTRGSFPSTPGCGHRLLRPPQGPLPHLGVSPKHTRVHSSSSQTAARPLAALRCDTKAHPGALIVFSDHHNVPCCT